MEQMGDVTVKLIYSSYTETFPPPRIECVRSLEHVTGGWKRVWGRLKCHVFDTQSRDIYWKLLHDILPTRRRRFELGIIPDEYCVHCERETCRLLGPWTEEGQGPGSMVVDGMTEDVVHQFCTCGRTREAWSWIRRIILKFVPPNFQQISDFDVIHLLFPQSGVQQTNTVLWLLSRYIMCVYVEVHRKDNILTLHKVRSILESQYLAHLCARGLPLLSVDFN